MARDRCRPSTRSSAAPARSRRPCASATAATRSQLPAANTRHAARLELGGGAARLVDADGAWAQGLEPVLQTDVLGDGCPALPPAGAEGLGRPPRLLRRTLVAEARGGERQVEPALRGIGLEPRGVESGNGSRQLVDDVLVEAGHGHHLGPGNDLGVDAMPEVLQLLLGVPEVPERAGQVAAPGVDHRPVVHDIGGEARQVGGAVDPLGVVEVTLGLVDAAEVQPGHSPVVQGAGARSIGRSRGRRAKARSAALTASFSRPWR